MANQQPGTPTSVTGGGGGSTSGASGSNSTSAGSPQQFCLRWNNYQTNLTNVFDQLLQSESFVDVTLACDGHSVKAHKMVLSACSPYFQALFFDNPCQHPIVIMKDIKWPELKAAVEFMYKGEINVSQEQIGPLLRVAESLKIRGLADVNSEHELASRIGVGVGAILGRNSPHDESSLNLIQQQQQLRKKRRLASSDRSPSNCSPERGDQMGEDCSSAGGNTPSETPRSMGSPSIPSISVTPQINLHELPLTSLSNALLGSGNNGHNGSSGNLHQAHQREQSGMPAGTGIGSHVSGSHVVVGSPGGSGGVSGSSAVGQQQTNHLGAAAHAVAQQLSVQQQHHQHHHHHHHGGGSGQSQQVADELEIKPGIAEMIREEERVSDFYENFKVGS
ncbi:hypothetical protein QAD02_017907 [Eretmocerus hayati]|uniref:Uncharacterized protein n=1 Tax=Eretmocerus hayati TaxID=131215 RepID=A0ACC2PFA2_9HYME|nr:hypothetical protein QAD02_017907 [Eretmocerus hayati]